MQIRPILPVQAGDVVRVEVGESFRHVVETIRVGESRAPDFARESNMIQRTTQIRICIGILIANILGF